MTLFLVPPDPVAQGRASLSSPSPWLPWGRWKLLHLQAEIEAVASEHSPVPWATRRREAEGPPRSFRLARAHTRLAQLRLPGSGIPCAAADGSRDLHGARDAEPAGPLAVAFGVRRHRGFGIGSDENRPCHARVCKLTLASPSPPPTSAQPLRNPDSGKRGPFYSEHGVLLG